MEDSTLMSETDGRGLGRGTARVNEKGGDFVETTVAAYWSFFPSCVLLVVG